MIALKLEGNEIFLNKKFNHDLVLNCIRLIRLLKTAININKSSLPWAFCRLREEVVLLLTVELFLWMADERQRHFFHPLQLFIVDGSPLQEKASSVALMKIC